MPSLRWGIIGNHLPPIKMSHLVLSCEGKTLWQFSLPVLLLHQAVYLVYSYIHIYRLIYWNIHIYTIVYSLVRPYMSKVVRLHTLLSVRCTLNQSNSSRIMTESCGNVLAAIVSWLSVSSKTPIRHGRLNLLITWGSVRSHGSTQTRQAPFASILRLLLPAVTMESTIGSFHLPRSRRFARRPRSRSIQSVSRKL